MASKANLGAPPPPTRAATRRARACAVCLRPAETRNGDSNASSGESSGFEILVVSLHDQVSGDVFLTPPGGAIEPGESALACAVRETREETGYDVRPALTHGPARATDSAGVTVRYDFVWEGQTFDCVTTFFACELTDPAQVPPPVQDAYYNRGAKWIAAKDVARSSDFMPIPRDAILLCLQPWLGVRN